MPLLKTRKWLGWLSYLTIWYFAREKQNFVYPDSRSTKDIKLTAIFSWLGTLQK